MAEIQAAKPIRRSLSKLALLAMRETGAAGYSFYRRSLETGALVFLDAYGLSLPELGQSSRDDLVVASYPLRTGGVATGLLRFGFLDKATSDQARSGLDRIARAIEAAWQSSYEQETYRRLADRVGQLEQQLSDLKIVDRVEGLLAGASLAPGALEIAAGQVESGLRTRRLYQTLLTLLRELEEEIEERSLTAQAKAVLQNTCGMSEEQAHVHLRITSRKTRRRMKDVARNLIATASA